MRELSAPAGLREALTAVLGAHPCGHWRSPEMVDDLVEVVSLFVVLAELRAVLPEGCTCPACAAVLVEHGDPS